MGISVTIYHGWRMRWGAQTSPKGHPRGLSSIMVCLCQEDRLLRTRGVSGAVGGEDVCVCVLARGGVSAQGRFPSSALGVRSVCTLLVLGANRQGGSTPLDPWGSGWSQCFLWEGWMISPISGMSLLGVVCQVTEGISSS